MTNWTMTREMTEEERDKKLPCFVHHDDAGGQCERPATMKVYGLNYCKEHGAEVGQGATMEARYEAGNFFERMRNPHVPEPSDLIGWELEALSKRLNGDANDDRRYRELLVRAYPETATSVRDEMDRWVREEDLGLVQDALLHSLHTLHKLLRIAHEEAETWLMEQLEIMRQKEAARCAYAMQSEQSGARLHSV